MLNYKQTCMKCIQESFLILMQIFRNEKCHLDLTQCKHHIAFKNSLNKQTKNTEYTVCDVFKHFVVQLQFNQQA